MQELPLPPVSLGHGIYDLLITMTVVGLAILKGVDFARKYGFLPERESTTEPLKTVGRLSVDSLKLIVRHEVRDQLQPLAIKMSDYSSKQLDKLEEINLGIREVATILRERR